MAKYNRASARARAVVKVWNNATGRGDPHLGAVLASEEALAAAGKIRKVLAACGGADGFSREDLQTRFEHFYAECQEIIPGAGAALENEDMQAFAGHVDRSQELTDTLLGNQVPETIFLAASARRCGALTASAFGAGFGGTVWALVAADKVDSMLEQWRQEYRRNFAEASRRSAFFQGWAGPAAFELT